jgi:hypothetical protein
VIFTLQHIVDLMKARYQDAQDPRIETMVGQLASAAYGEGKRLGSFLSSVFGLSPTIRFEITIVTARRFD